MLLGTKHSYEVRFVYYRYNNGRADNGHFGLTEKFQTLELAKAFAQDLERRITEKENTSNWFWETFYINGYPTRVDGIWKITEEKIT